MKNSMKRSERWVLAVWQKSLIDLWHGRPSRFTRFHWKRGYGKEKNRQAVNSQDNEMKDRKILKVNDRKTVPWKNQKVNFILFLVNNFGISFQCLAQSKSSGASFHFSIFHLWISLSFTNSTTFFYLWLHSLNYYLLNSSKDY